MRLSEWIYQPRHVNPRIQEERNALHVLWIPFDLKQVSDNYSFSSFIKQKAVLCNQMKVLCKNNAINMYIIALSYIITKL